MCAHRHRRHRRNRRRCRLPMTHTYTHTHIYRIDISYSNNALHEESRYLFLFVILFIRRSFLLFRHRGHCCRLLFILFFSHFPFASSFSFFVVICVVYWLDWWTDGPRRIHNYYYYLFDGIMCSMHTHGRSICSKRCLYAVRCTKETNSHAHPLISIKKNLNYNLYVHRACVMCPVYRRLLKCTCTSTVDRSTLYYIIIIMILRECVVCCVHVCTL